MALLTLWVIPDLFFISFPSFRSSLGAADTKLVSKATDKLATIISKLNRCLKQLQRYNLSLTCVENAIAIRLPFLYSFTAQSQART